VNGTKDKALTGVDSEGRVEWKMRKEEKREGIKYR
jgi:hypothetical protein